MNLLKYDYEPMDLPNIYMAYRKDSDRRPAKLQPKLKELALAVAKKYPNWKLVTTNYFTYDDYYLVTRLDVFDGDEVLGRLAETYYSSERVYEITNPRIAATRTRGNSTKTKDIKKALKVISKSFGSKTIWERLDDTTESLHDQIRRAYYYEERKFLGHTQDMFRRVYDHAIENWHEYKDVFLNAGVSEDMWDKACELRDARIQSMEVEKCATGYRGAVVLIHGGVYFVCKSDTSQNMRKFTSDDLPEQLRAAIGLLKLVESNKILANVGLKRSDTEFFVMVEDAVWMK